MKKAQKKALAVGAGVAALAAAAAGTYFFAGKHGAKNRKKVAAWADKAKREVMAELGTMKKMSKEAYNKSVDNVMKNYKAMKNVDTKELTAMAQELKGHWNSIAKEVASASQKVAQALPVKVTAKKSASRKVKVKKAPAKPAARKKATKKRR